MRPVRLSLAAALLLAAVLLGSGPTSAAGVPRILNHQGRLFDSAGNLLGGSGTDYCFRFSIYDDATVGAPDSQLWPAATATAMSVRVRQGVFSVGVGDTAAGGDTLNFDFESSENAHLNIEVATKVGGSCTNGDETFENLQPRQRIAASGYAINSATLRGFHASQNATSGIPVLTSGNLVLGGTNPQVNATGTNALTLQGNANATGSIQFFGASNFISSTGTLNIAGILQAANVNQFLTTTSTPTFAGLNLSGFASGNIVFATTSGALASSTDLFWDATNVRMGIGTNTPSSTLHVVGGTALQQLTFTYATGTRLYLSNSDSIPIQILSSSTQHILQAENSSGIEQFRVSAAGHVFANGFIARQMQFSEEFLRTNAAVVNDTAGGGTTGLGDSFSWGVGSTANAHVSVAPVADAVNGAMRLTVTGGTGRGGLLYLSAAAGNRNDILNASSSPIIVMKLRPSVVGTNNLIFAGMMDYTDGGVTDPTNGIYFTNASGTTWVGVARSSNAQTSVTCTGQTVSTTTDAYFRIQVNGTSSVEFHMDNNTSNGIDTTSCGTVTSTIPTILMTAEIMNQVRTGGTQPANVDIDFVRLLQDDPVSPSAGSGEQSGPDEGADIAEETQTLEPEAAEPGDVVSLVAGRRATIARSGIPYDSALYGVITTHPGMILGSGTTSSVRIALIGRVPVKVSTENGPVRAGDWLTSSGRIGIAMRATQPGMALGRALEDMNGATGTILASVEVGYYAGSPWQRLESLTSDAAAAASDLVRFATEGVRRFVELAADKIVARVASVGSLFARTATILPEGELRVPAGANELSGRGVVPAGLTEIFIPHSKVTGASKIFLTPAVPIAGNLAVVLKTEGQGFKVALASAAERDVPFDWLILQSYGEDVPRQPSPSPEVGSAPAEVPVSENPASPEPAPEESPPAEESPPTPAEAAPEPAPGTETEPQPKTPAQETEPEPAS